MERGRGVSIVESFEGLEDPRIDRCKRHQLLDIITIAICAVICGADSWVHGRCSARARRIGFAPLDLPHGIPSHDTFGDVFSRLDSGPLPGVFHGMEPVSGRVAARRGGGH